MTARIIDGRAIARQVVDEVRDEIGRLLQAGHSPPSIAVVRVADDPASVRYAGQVERAFTTVGLGFQLVALADAVDESALIDRLRSLGADPAVTAILLQLPLPPRFTHERVVEAIDPLKDVDGINPLNAGRLLVGHGRFFAPATALGGVELLRRSDISIAGKHAVVVGRSEIVGRPLALLLLRRHATVTICHSRTPDLGHLTRQADIVAVAVGRPGLITGEMVAPGAVVVDFGVNVVNGKVVGDVDASSVAEVAAALTPVPGGTGPMTNALLLANTLDAVRWQHNVDR